MNEEPTKDLPAGKSFEARMFARFDALDARLEKLEARSFDTKPIWERALALIGDMGHEVSAIKTDVAVLKTDVAVLKTDVAVLKTEVTEIKYELKDFKREVTKRLDEVQVTHLGNKINIRDAHDRIDKLERRLA